MPEIVTRAGEIESRGNLGANLPLYGEPNWQRVWM